MKKRLSILMACILVLAMTLTGCAAKNKGNIRMGTGSIGGNYYSYGMNLANMVITETDYEMDVQVTSGSAANLRLISKDYLDMAIAQSDTINDALNGTGAFEGEPLTGFHTVANLYTESCQIIVPSVSAIESVEDLVGRRVSIGAKDSGVLKNATEILAAYGISINDLNVSYLGFAESAEKLKKGEIDAFFATASAPTTAIVDLAAQTPVRVLPISQEVTKSLLETNESYVTSMIPAGTYTGIDSDIPTIGVSAVLICNDKVSAETEGVVLNILKSQNENLQEVSFGVAAPEKVEETNGFKLSLDMYQTLALAVLVLLIGDYLRKKIKVLEMFCIPAPVIGGLLFAILSCVLYATGIMEFSFDETLKTVCMVIFFTSVGFQANLKVLKSGGPALAIFVVTVGVLIVCQNCIAVGLSKVLGQDPMIGLCTGSIPMVGGHGTAGAFGQVLEDLGLKSATTLSTAAATFGLVMGSLMGGPLGNRLITKHDLVKTAITNADDTALVKDREEHDDKHVSQYGNAAYQLAIAMGLGTIVSFFLSKTGMTFPIYIGSMIVAAIMRNIGEYTNIIDIRMGEIDDIGGICLSLFLGIAMVTLKLWQLAELALPLIVLLLGQTIFMAFFAYFVVFNVMGRDYDAAVLASGTCGFGMGATPNAMANMQAVTGKFVPSVKAFILVPIIGSMFADFINSLVITGFINFVK